MATISKTLIIDREVLERLGDARLSEARALQDRHFAGCIYLAGYAIECWLKVAICKTLECDRLPGAFKVHDLEALLLYSGLKRRLEAEINVHRCWRQIVGMWVLEGDEAFRYRDPLTITQGDATDFLEWVSGTHGVLTWLKGRI